MNVKLEKYLNAVDKHLRPLPVSERSDIVREIRGSVIEMKNEGVSEDQILERLGNPKEMSKAYLGSLLEKKESSGWNKILIICAFYSMVGLTGMIIIPVLAVIAPVFIVLELMIYCIYKNVCSAYTIKHNIFMMYKIN